VAIRNIRRDANRAAEQGEKDKELTEDERDQTKDEIQDLTKKFENRANEPGQGQGSRGHGELTPTSDMQLRICRIMLAAILLVGIGVPLSAAERVLLARALVEAPRVLVIAHRGDSAAAPENTLPAFASAIRAGADLVELDYHHSADGVPVVLHDPTLDRTTDARARFGAQNVEVATKSLEELLQLDAG
jgi:hypothetical protein